MKRAPSGFISRLRAFDPALSVRFHPATGGWQIFEDVKQWVDHGSFRGSRLVVLKSVPQYIGQVPGLGDVTFRMLRRGIFSRFGSNRTYEEFCGDWNVQVE